MIDAEEVAAMLYSATSTAKPGPIPTVIPTPPHYQFNHATGERTLWVVFGLMALSAGVFAVMSWNVPTSKRVYHVTTTLITIISALAYFAMASGQSSSLVCHAVRDHNKHVPDTFHDECRQVFWGRYVDWALTSPLVLLNLSLLAGLDGAHTLMAIVADVIMVLGGVFAAYGDESTAQVWGWFIISCLGYLFVVWHVGVQGAKMVQSKGVRVSRLWGTLAVYSLTLWLAYPIVWAIATLGKRTTVDTEILIFAVLDLLVKPVFGFWLLVSNRALAETNIDLAGYWSQGLSAEGRIRIGDEE